MIKLLPETNGFVKKKIQKSVLIVSIDRGWVFFYNSDRFKKTIKLKRRVK
jgi:hypothetical protein